MNTFGAGDFRIKVLQMHGLKKEEGLPRNGLRGLFWKIFLNYLPVDPSEWADTLLPKREHYEQLLQE